MYPGEEHKQQLIDDIRRFVRIPSRSSAKGGEEGELQSVMAERMGQLGARVRTFEADDVPLFRSHPLCHGPERQYQGRPTVIGEMGPPEARPLLIMAHSDTVQIGRPEEWTFDPFCGEVRDDAVCGLGASDDKWGLAAMLVIMRALRESYGESPRRVVFASTIDEENGVGNGALLLHLAGVRAEAALYLDGIGLTICVGSGGGSNLYLRPQAEVPQESAARNAERLADACREFSRRRAALYNHPFFRSNPARDQSVVFSREEDEQGPLLVIRFYTVPGEERETFSEELEEVVTVALAGDTSLYARSWREPWFEPSLNSGPTPLLAHLGKSVREVLAREPETGTSFKQDSFVLRNHADIPVIAFGVARRLGRGGAHGPDEAVSIADAWSGCRIACGAVRRWVEHGT